MQTFLPYPSFSESAKVLDNKRLCKQRVEAYQILKALTTGPIKPDGTKTAWYNHPAVQMWKGCEHFLIRYIMSMCNEWLIRGYKDTTRFKALALLKKFREGYGMPIWWGDERLHASHRSNLLRKDPKHYGQFGWKEPNDLPYWWPTKETIKCNVLNVKKKL